MWIGWKAVSLGIVSGGAIAVALYSSMAPGAGPIGASIPVSEVSGATVVYADCVPPAELEDGDCVTHVTVTTTTPASAAPAEHPAASTSSSQHTVSVKSSSPTSASSSTTHHDDDHDGDDHDGDHDDDHDDDHGDGGDGDD